MKQYIKKEKLMRRILPANSLRSSRKRKKNTAEEQIRTFIGRRNTFIQTNDVTWRNTHLEKVKKHTEMSEIAGVWSAVWGWGVYKKGKKSSLKSFFKISSLT